MNKMRVEYSSSALLRQDIPQKVELAQWFCQTQGWDFGIQIHNTSTERFIEKIAASGAALSFHAPVCSEYFINLAGEDRSYAWQSLAKSAEIIKKLQGSLAVFHGFLMTDRTILCFNRDRSFDECMAEAYRPELSVPGLDLCSDFFGSEEYAQRLARVQQRLHQAQQDFPEVRWCIENDYPLYGAGLLLAEHICRIDHDYCLDVSHLWVSSLLFHKNFWEQAETIARTGRVACVHFHANPVTAEMPLADYRDGHQSLTIPNQMKLERLARILYQSGIRHWVIETPEADLADLQLLADWLSH